MCYVTELCIVLQSCVLCYQTEQKTKQFVLFYQAVCYVV